MMSDPTRSDPGLQRFAPLLWAAYAVAFMLTVMPMVNLLTSIWPLQPGAVRWRFGAAGLLSGSVTTPIMGLFFAMLAAALLRHRRPLLLLSGVTGILALLLIVTSGMFILDTLQLRGEVVPEMVQSYTVTSGRALVQLGLNSIVCLILAVSGYRAIRYIPRRATAAHRSAGATLMNRPSTAGQSVR